MYRNQADGRIVYDICRLIFCVFAFVAVGWCVPQRRKERDRRDGKQEGKTYSEGSASGRSPSFLGLLEETSQLIKLLPLELGKERRKF